MLLFCIGICIFLIRGVWFSPQVSMLPPCPGADWIVFPKPVLTQRQPVAPVPVIFRKDVTLTSDQPAEARLQFRASRGARIYVNGGEVTSQAGGSWKSVWEANLTSVLRAGTNRIEVVATNPIGPPALWALLHLPGQLIPTDESWETSFGGSDWRGALTATGRGTLLPSQADPGGLKAAALERWPWLVGALLLGVALALFWPRLPKPPGRADTLAFAVIALLWSLPLFANLPRLPNHLGFDTQGHVQYINLIVREGGLPAPDAGWETHQPPLYYLLGAGLLKATGTTDSPENSLTVLRILSILIGWAHLWFVLLSLRILFPAEAGARIAGMLFAGAVPMLLYLSHYVTNELLSACLISASLYLALRVLTDTEPGRRWYLTLGLVLGLAILTKVTAVLLVPCVGMALLARAWVSRAKNHWIGLGLVLLSCLAICGGQFLRMWLKTGHPLFAPTESAYGIGWWQDPGYRTAGYFLSFGESLGRPFFSAAASFWDGIYSTMWGDALVSGASTLSAGPAWDYALIRVAMVLAIAPTLLLLAGFVVMAGKVRTSTHTGWVLLGSYAAVMLLALVHLNLSVPAYGVAKAFYGLSTLLPLSVAAVLGWNWINQRSRFAAVALAGIGCVFAVTSYGAYWLRSKNPNHSQTNEVELALREVRATYQAGSFPATISRSRKGLALAPLDPELHFYLGLALEGQARAGQPAALISTLEIPAGLTNEIDRTLMAALAHYRHTLSIAPGTAEAASRLAWIMSTHPDPLVRNGGQALEYARRANQLVPENPAILRALAAAEAENGDLSGARTTASKALAKARQEDLAPLAGHLEKMLASFNAGNAWRQ